MHPTSRVFDPDAARRSETRQRTDAFRGYPTNHSGDFPEAEMRFRTSPDSNVMHPHATRLNSNQQSDYRALHAHALDAKRVATVVKGTSNTAGMALSVASFFPPTAGPASLASIAANALGTVTGEVSARGREQAIERVSEFEAQHGLQQSFDESGSATAYGRRIRSRLLAGREIEPTRVSIPYDLREHGAFTGRPTNYSGHFSFIPGDNLSPQPQHRASHPGQQRARSAQASVNRGRKLSLSSSVLAAASFAPNPVASNIANAAGAALTLASMTDSGSEPRIANSSFTAIGNSVPRRYPTPVSTIRDRRDLLGRPRQHIAQGGQHQTENSDQQQRKAVDRRELLGHPPGNWR